jgi:hypothetical protein
MEIQNKTDLKFFSVFRIMIFFLEMVEKLPSPNPVEQIFFPVKKLYIKPQAD